MVKSKILKIKSAVISGLVAVTALSAPFSSGAPDNLMASAASYNNYAKLLQYSLYFYDANMCGSQVSEKSQLTWRGDCHTSDEVDGGFHDAGDHAMFGLPQGYTASTIGWAYYEFKDSFDSLGQTEHFKTIATYFSDFFKNCTKLSGNSVSSFCIQKGLGNTDHSYWGPPETQGDRGGCDWRTSGCGDIAAEYAASLAVNYINFGNEEDLTYAKALYNYAKNNASVCTGDCTGFYKSDSVTDDIAWAAGWLYLATGDSSYKTDCANNQVQYLGWVHDWNNVSLGAACLYSHITGDWSKVNSWIGGQTTGSSYWFASEWGSARYNATMQMCALVATKNSSADYSSWCQGQMDYLLGSNPTGTCFVVGLESNSAKNPHHRAASGYKNYDEMGTNASISSNGHVLVGALVGGPSNAGGSYQDTVQDYKCNEVACDYNAGLVGAAAGLYSIYKTGSLATSIEGVKSISVPIVTTTSPIATTTTTTTPKISDVQTTTTTTKSPDLSEGKYSLNVNKTYTYSNLGDNKMIGFPYADFGLTASSTAKIQKVEVRISTANGSIGTWQGAFGSSTTAAPDYWTQTDQMEENFSGSSGTITWNVDSATANIIQYGYDGELKFGIWWIDCNTFTIDSVTLYTDETAIVTTPSSTTTTTKTTTTTTTTTINTTGNPVYGDANRNGTIEIADAVFILQGISDPSNKEYDLLTTGTANADCYKPGGGVDAEDALAIQQYKADIIPSLPVY